MSYWKTKVLPKIKKYFDKGKKKGASEVCKSFDKSKESLEKELGEKSPDLQPKVVEIYRSSTVEIQKLFKEPNETAVKGNPEGAQNVLQELAKAGVPGAQQLCDAGIKFGPALLPGPIVFLLEKTSTFLVEEPVPEVKESTREATVEVEAPTTATAADEAPADVAVEKEPTEVAPPAETAAPPAETAPEAAPEVPKAEPVDPVEKKPE